MEVWTVPRKPGNVIITPVKSHNVEFFEMQSEEQKALLFMMGKTRNDMSATAICHYYMSTWSASHHSQRLVTFMSRILKGWEKNRLRFAREDRMKYKRTVT